jgi:hypothetical protein
VLIDLHQLPSEGDRVGLPKIKRYKWTDIYPELTVTYTFDAGKDGNAKTISIAKVDKPERDIDSVGGVTDTLVGNELWNRGRLLYKAYGGYKNELPTPLRNYGWLSAEEDVIASLQDFYTWQGVKTSVEDGITVHTVYERYTAEMILDISFILTNNLDLGSKIRLDYPFRRAGTDPHSGIITSIQIDPISFKATVLAHMAGDVLSGGDTGYIIEDEANVDTITEDENNTDTITEGA